MPVELILSHKVENFDQWKQFFDAGASMRNDHGIVVKGVYQSVNDANHVTVITTAPNAETANAVDENFQKSMVEAGVDLSTLEMKVLNQVV